MDTAENHENLERQKVIAERQKQTQEKKDAIAARRKDAIEEWRKLDSEAQFEQWTAFTNLTGEKKDEKKTDIWSSMTEEEAKTLCKSRGMQLLRKREDGLIVGDGVSQQAKDSLISLIYGNQGQPKTNFDWTWTVIDLEGIKWDLGLRLDAASQWIRLGAHAGVKVPHLQITSLTTELKNGKGDIIMDEPKPTLDNKKKPVLDENGKPKMDKPKPKLRSQKMGASVSLDNSQIVEQCAPTQKALISTLLFWLQEELLKLTFFGGMKHSELHMTARDQRVDRFTT